MIHFIFSEHIPTSTINDSLGRVKLINTPPDGKACYCREQDIEQIENVLVDFNTVLEQLKSDFKYGSEFLVAACARGHGNFRPKQGDGRGNALAIEIDKHCHCIFGNEEDAQFFLKDKGIRYEGSFEKPVFYCSDAHEIDDLGSRYTWIKADPTFNGLMQTLFEPEGRVKIQSGYPDEKNDYEVIDKVRFIDRSSKKIFPEEWIEINPGLNSIIGGKSSGKSLLLYHIAKTIDPEKTRQAIEHGDGSIRYSYKYDVDIEVAWRDGKSVKLSEGDKTSERRPITFIPQLYLNAVAEKGGKDFHEVINDILKEQEGYEDWYTNKREDAESKKKEIHASVNDYMALYRRHHEEHDALKKLGDKQAIQNNLKALKKKMEELKKSAEMSDEELKTYARLEQEKNDASNNLKALSTKERLYADLQEAINGLQRQIPDKLLEPFSEHLSMKYSSLDKAKEIIDSALNGLKSRFNKAITDGLDDIKKSAPNFEEGKAALEAQIKRPTEALIPFHNKIKNRELFGKLAESLKSEDQKLKKISDKENELSAISTRLGSIKLADKLSELLRLYKDIIQENEKYSEIDSENETILISELTFDQERFHENVTSRIYKKMSLAKQVSDEIFTEDNEFRFTEESYKESIEPLLSGITLAKGHSTLCN